MTKTVVAAAVAAVSLLASPPAPAQAGGVARAFSELEAEHARASGIWTAYASGAAEGLAWANSMLEARDERRLYCPPRGAVQNPRETAQIALSEYKGNKPRYDSLDKQPAEAVALAAVSGLIAKWPCK